MPGVRSHVVEPSSAELADRTRYHVALRQLPFLFVLYIVNYLDRTSVAYAAIGMSRDLAFSARVFGLGAGIFFVSYVALQVPGALLVERWSARRTISATMIAWGLATALTGLVHTPAQLYLARFALGAAEASFFPGVIVYLSHWFTHEDRARATSNFMAAIPVSFVVGSPIAGWILGHKWLAAEGWRWLFFLEGMPAVLLGIVAFFYLTDWPREANWLSPEQKQWISEKLAEQKPHDTHALSIRDALRSRTILLLATVTFLNYFESYSFYFWFPSMLKKQSGLSDVNVGLLGAVPYAVLFIAMQVNGFLSDRSHERHWHSAVPLFVATAGFLGLITQTRSIPISFSLVFFTMACLGSAYLPVFWAIPGEILSQSTAAAAIGMINGVGSIAGFASPYLFGYLNSQTGSFTYGLAVLMVSAFAGGLLILFTPKRV